MSVSSRGRCGAVACAGVVASSIALLGGAPCAVASMTTGATGGNVPYSTRQPTLGLQFAMHDQGSLGEIRIFPYQFLPQLWIPADGRSLTKASNPALAAELGDVFGGDATNFSIPNLFGALPVGTGQGFGLTTRARGDRFGADDVTLTEDQMPVHSHTLSGGGDSGDAGGGQSHSTVQNSLGVSLGIQTTGVYPSPNRTIAVAGSSSQPFLSQIRMFSGSTTPSDVHRCDGTNLALAQNTALFSLLGTTYGGNGATTFGLPDLQGRTPIGAGQGIGLTDRALGEELGQETITLDTAHMPAHTHTDPGGNTDSAGSSLPIRIMQPSLGISFAIRLEGVYPSDTSAMNPGLDYLGEIIMLAGNFAPQGYALCEGQLLPIFQNTALFSLIGDAFGGDGESTFALPDLRGRGLNGVGNPFRARVGEMLGSEFASLTVDNLPSHVHELPTPGGVAALALAGVVGIRRRR